MARLDELRGLSPRERLRRLKELEEERKKEIQEAQELIKQSEGEIEREEQLRREIPIPQVKAVDIEHLFSPEEKRLFEAKRFVQEKKKTEEGEELPQERSLEETVEREKKNLTPKQLAEQQQYRINLIEAWKTKPTEYITNRLEEIRNTATAEMSLRQENEQYAAYSILKEREEMMRRGEYGRAEDGRIDRQVQEELNLGLSIAKELRDMYRR
jgi:hypothetical protein